MKKQLNPTIKAHLIRSGCYLRLLLAVVAIPFALAQRNAGRQTLVQRQIALEPAQSKGLAVAKPDLQGISPKADAIAKMADVPASESPDLQNLNYPMPPSASL